jgi:hypothetical protein
MWLHHTGHDKGKAYGTKTREWQFDTVAMLNDRRSETTGRLIHFSCQFTKARQRTPQNRADFATAEVWIGEDDAWRSSSLSPTKSNAKPPSPMAKKLNDALVHVICTTGQRGLPFDEAPPAVTRAQWREEAIRRGLIRGDAKPNQMSAKLHKYQEELIAADWIAVHREWVWLTRNADDEIG